MSVVNGMPEAKLIPDDARKMIAERLNSFRDHVNVEVYTKDGEQDEFNAVSVGLVTELAEISPKIVPKFFKIGDTRSKEMGVERTPTILIAPEKYKIRYTGAPAGEEGRSFMQIIEQVSLGDSMFSQKVKARLAQLKEKRNIQVFVTPTCPYCPGEVLNAFGAAMARPDIISAECVESMENVDLARKFNVGSVPHTVVNEVTISKGLQPEDRFVEGLFSMKPYVEPVQQAQPPHEHQHDQPSQASGAPHEHLHANAPPGHQHTHDQAAPDEPPTVKVDLVVVGAGPAGLTAAIYAKRSGLETVVLEAKIVGGQVSITPIVENWPGFKSVPGAKLMEMMGAQAREYVQVRENEPVREIKIGKHIEAITSKARYEARGIVLAMGAEHKKLGVPGEDRLSGRGVAYCATCDGFFYKDRDVLVVGGGNTALTDAIYLHSLGARVALVHRKGEFRAEKHLVDSWKATGRPTIWNTVVEEIVGDDRVAAVMLKNVSTGAGTTLPIEGVFVSVGFDPKSELAKEIGVGVDEAGFIKADRSMRTNIPRVYAAGDISGGVRQIVTAVGTGATAAVSAFEDLSGPYWKDKKR
jgi:thioredoxin reductase (NADPH)